MGWAAFWQEQKQAGRVAGQARRRREQAEALYDERTANLRKKTDPEVVRVALNEESTEPDN